MIRASTAARKYNMEIIDRHFKKGDDEIIKLINKSHSAGITDNELAEWLKCRANPLYFILNYCYIRTVGLKMLTYKDGLLHPKFRRCIRILYRYHKCILLATRQLGKSSLAACMIAWGMNFYPNNSAVILNMRKDAALENIKKIRHVLENLPQWMRVRAVSDSNIKTYYELMNMSKVTTYYPSSTHPPETLARSLTVPMLYIDEAAFIPHIDEIYGSAQQTLSTARKEAESIGHPWFVLMTSTTNGVVGDGEFFYNMYMNAVDSDEIFDENEELVENHEEIVSNPSKNGFVRVKYHWSECPTKDEKWYLEQCRELNFDKRKINQELDLVFVASSQCMFSDDVLQKIKPRKVLQNINLPHGAILKVFSMPNNRDYYFIGVDTAKSAEGDYTAIEVFSFKDFLQIAECKIRLDTLKRITDIVHGVVSWFWKTMNIQNLVLCIENNTYGSAVIENLLYNIEDELSDEEVLKNVKPVDYEQIMFVDKVRKQTGINTNAKTKELMITLAYQLITERPDRIRSNDLAMELSSIERNSRGTIKTKQNDDLFMAMCFCAYARRFMYDTLFPRVEYTEDELTSELQKEVGEILELSFINSITKPEQDNLVFSDLDVQSDHSAEDLALILNFL